MAENKIDPLTGRAFGDHGTANDALEWALDHGPDVDFEAIGFLIDWRDGSAFEKYPEFYIWLKEQNR
jgi:hypothetical protein